MDDRTCWQGTIILAVWAVLLEVFGTLLLSWSVFFYTAFALQGLWKAL